MQFSYDHLMTLVGFSKQEIRFFEIHTGYGKLYHNYTLAKKYLSEDYLPYTVIICQKWRK